MSLGVVNVAGVAPPSSLRADYVALGASNPDSLNQSNGALLGNYAPDQRMNIADFQNRNNVHGASAALTGQTATNIRQPDVARLVDHIVGRSDALPQSWRSAGATDLTTLNIRAENLRSLAGNEFARIFVPSAKGDNRVAVHFLPQTSHWQQWLGDGGLKYGPSAALQIRAQSLIDKIGNSSPEAIVVINQHEALKRANFSIAENAGQPSQIDTFNLSQQDIGSPGNDKQLNGFIWSGVPGPVIAHQQSLSRAHS